MSDLSTYRSKRDFTKTSEPQGRAAAEVDGTFVIQKHAARRLHYDFRLGIGSVLVSWAVTKGPSLDPAHRRLAIRTEDHPANYGCFEGTIPKREYGGGSVMLWDRGTFTVEGDAGKGLSRGKLKLTLAGSRLQGGFALIRMDGKAGPRKQRERRENWLLIKERDGFADAHATLGSDDDRSVVSGRTMDEIAKGAAVKRGRRPQAATRAGKNAAGRLSKKEAFIKPQLATLVEEAPEGEGWLFETKFDGYRLIAACDGDAVRCFTRSGQDWTRRVPVVAAALARLDLTDTLLDGELVVTDAAGFSDFGALQAALKTDPQRLSLVVFDILRDKGRDLRGEPLMVRKKRLAKCLCKARTPLHLADYATGKGARIAAAACRHGLEGIIAKRADASYKSRRTRDWLKIKCVKEQEFVVGGWSPSTRSRAFSSLLLGVHDQGRDTLRYAGRVGSGFNDAQLRAIAVELKRRARKTSPFDKVPAAVKRGARWVTPDLVAQVRFTEMTRDGAVRHAVFQGLREDKDAAEVVAERPAAAARKKGKNMAGSTAKNRQAEVAGVRLTHPDKLLYPAMGVTKRELADYLAGIAEAMLPEVTDRPVSLLRCPEGRGEACFFQKHAGSGLPEPIEKIAIEEKSGTRKDYLLFNTKPALVACAQVGALELHLWASRRDKLERPDRMVFDLDPGEGVDFAAVRAAAADLRDVLREADLESWPLLTGGKGIHLVIVLERRVGWAAFSGFAKDFAEKMSELDPDRFVATMSKAKRKGRIFIDHFRNRRGATAIAPFSPRAREGAPVAVPVSWKELERVKRANAFTLGDSLADLKQRVAAWPAEAERRVRLTSAAAERLGLELKNG